ncbi:MAG: hypothetical protein KAV87_28760, partial [Desulfobacteraceae bacterium]|nr:hypothetical protein [Desulfobacteraceae bacterium]
PLSTGASMMSEVMLTTRLRGSLARCAVEGHGVGQQQEVPMRTYRHQVKVGVKPNHFWNCMGWMVLPLVSLVLVLYTTILLLKPGGSQ